MDSLYLEQTEQTPKVSLDSQKGIIEFIGQSYPDNTFEFYEQTIKWFKEY